MAPDPAWRNTLAIASEPERAPTLFVEAPPQDLDPSVATMQERVVARRLAEIATADYRPIGFAAYEVPAPAPLPAAIAGTDAHGQDGFHEIAPSDGAMDVAAYEEGDPEESLAGG